MTECLQAEREELWLAQQELEREVKRKDLLIAAYIPPRYQQTIMRNAQWDDYEGAWAVNAMALSGNALRAQRDIAAAQKAHLDAAYGATDGAASVPQRRVHVGVFQVARQVTTWWWSAMRALCGCSALTCCREEVHGMARATCRLCLLL